MNQKKQTLTHLSVNSKTQFKFDELVYSYEQVIDVSQLTFFQVYKFGKALAQKFITTRKTHKIVLNVVDQFAMGNNCGFNLANF